MEGVKETGFRATSIVWEGGPIKQRHTNGKADLQERLEEFLVFVIYRDGGQGFKTLTLRGLYKYVLAAITDPETVRKTSEASPKKTRSHGAGLNQTETNPDSKKGSTSTISRDLRQNYFHSVHDLGGKLKDHSPEDPSEEVQRQEQTGVTYRERLGGYLHPCDMQKLVMPFSASNEPQVIVRRHVMLLNFDPLRAIILRDRLLLLVPDGADSLLTSLERKLRGNHNDSFFDEKKDTDVHFVDRGRKSVFDKVFKKGPRDSKHAGAEDGSRSRHGKESVPKESKDGSDGGSLSRHGRQAQAKDSISPVPPASKTTPAPHVPAKEKELAHPAEEATETETDDDDNFDDTEWDEIKGREWIELPFDMQCLDCVMQVVTEILSQDTREVQEATATQDYLGRVIRPRQRNQDPLTMIRTAQDSLREMKARVNGFVKSLTRSLDDDETMALMNLSRLISHPERFIQPVSEEILSEESDEPELILEAHLQDAMSLLNMLDLMQGQLDSTSELIDRQLDAVRNKLLVVNMGLQIVTLCLTVISVVGSIFGMNLTNGFEFDPEVFHQVTISSVCGSFALGLLILLALFQYDIIPKPRSGAST